MRDYDVIAIGSGAAGLMAALTAADRGASVLVLEASGELGGTTAFSGGMLWVPFNRWGSKAGAADSRERVERYLRRALGARADDVRWKTFLDVVNDVMAFLEAKTQLRFALTSYPDAFGEWPEGSTARHVQSKLVRLSAVGKWGPRIRRPAGPQIHITTHDLAGFRPVGLITKKVLAKLGPRVAWRKLTGRVGLGFGLIVGLLDAALRRGVTVECDARVVELVREGERVVGVVVESGGARTRIAARKAVVLACGGFDWNEKLMDEYLPARIEDTQSPPVNLGDGVVLARAAGARLERMDEAWYLPGRYVSSMPLYQGKPIGSWITGDRIWPHTLWVNARGERFCNEAAQNTANEMLRRDAGGGLVNLPAYVLFDAQYRAKYPVLRVLQPGQPDPDWLAKADTLGELARKLDLPGDALERSVARFNDMARRGRDVDFHRGEGAYEQYFGDPFAPHPTLGPLERPPFYGYRMPLSSVGTKGGAATNADGQVLSESGRPIAGLYAAGNAASAFNGPITVAAGCTITPALAMAWQAMRSALPRG